MLSILDFLTVSHLKSVIMIYLYYGTEKCENVKYEYLLYEFVAVCLLFD